MRHYLVDSENVNDNWLMLLEFTEMTDDIIVFYTDKSPHMSYTSLVRIVEQTHQIQFKKCYTGPNGLDFQLVSYLGYLMCDNQDSDDEFIIMSNDNGFDCVVKFWNNRNITVKRLDVAHCKQLYDQFLFSKQQDQTDLEQNESARTHQPKFLMSRFQLLRFLLNLFHPKRNRLNRFRLK